MHLSIKSEVSSRHVADRIRIHDGYQAAYTTASHMLRFRRDRVICGCGIYIVRKYQKSDIPLREPVVIDEISLFDSIVTTIIFASSPRNNLCFLKQFFGQTFIIIIYIYILSRDRCSPCTKTILHKKVTPYPHQRSLSLQRHFIKRSIYFISYFNEIFITGKDQGSCCYVKGMYKSTIHLLFV